MIGNRSSFLRPERENKMSQKKRQTKKVGIMGGTFDPIHIGHLILAESAYEQFGLDYVLVMPSGNPPHKKNREGGADNEQRTEMVRLAVASNPHLHLSLEEMHEMGYIYTSQTLARLRSTHPDTTYFFIMGTDSLFQFDTWHEPQQICDQCVLVAAKRDHVPSEMLDERIRQVAETYHADVRKLDTPNIDLSSHQIRQWISEGRSCRYYLPGAVRKYIEKTGLYRPVSGPADSLQIQY